MSNRRPLFTLLALSLAVAGCSTWDLGPEPDNSVGKGGNPQLPTDANLQAVTPHVPGDDPGGAAILPDMPATNPSTSPAATQVSNPATAPIADSLSVQEAILTGLEHNIELRVQRYSVPITRTAEETALSAFDPKVTGQLSGGRTVTGKQAPSAQPVNPNPIRGVAQDSINGSIDVTEFLPTGTTIDGKMSTSDRFYTDRNFSNDSSITVTQSLLRGAGLDVNLATLRKAEVSTKISQFQLRDTAESLVSNIELSYWDLAYAERQVVIVRNALDVAQKQLDDTRTRVNVDRLAPSELPAA